MTFRLNVNDGVDTIHREHGFEECNLDDAQDVQSVDEATAKAMLARGDAKVCEHCKPLGEPS
jgi:hypothetical protein